MDRLFEPVWAGPWAVFRVIWVALAFWLHLPRVAQLEDAYACGDLVMPHGAFPLAAWWVMTPTSGAIVWTVAMFGLLLAAWGGRVAKPGIVLFLIGSLLLLFEEAFNFKAYDKLLVWQGLVLLLAPIDERNLHRAWRPPVARLALLILYAFLYFDNSLAKIVINPEWLDGTALRYALVTRFHGQHMFGTWLSTQPMLCLVGAWYMLGFELSFPFLIAFRRTNPIALCLGVVFHVAILATLDVGLLSWVSMAAYPVLLHPDIAHDVWVAGGERFRQRS